MESMSGQADALVTVAPESKGLMLPPAPRSKRKREVAVLDEDEWTDKLEAIIQRDYFPDLPKLESQLEWLEVNSSSPSVHNSSLALAVQL